MKPLLLISVISLLLLAACQGPATVEPVSDSEETLDQLAEPTAEEISEDLSTDDLDAIEGDLDLIVIES